MNNYKRMTLNARGYLMNELRKIYNGKRVAVDQDSIRYGFYDDSDYAHAYEVMQFRMSDGVEYELYYSLDGKYLRALS